MPPDKFRILGIDPGSRLTGVGCITVQGSKLELFDATTMKLSGECMSERLGCLYAALSKLVQSFFPSAIALEKAFYSRNIQSSLRLGETRGAILTFAANHKIPLYEYSPNEVKIALVGHGHAGKEQVSAMVKAILGPHSFETLDASDATALAITHGLIKASRAEKTREKKGGKSIAESVRHRLE